jgi:soluble P-type ATPase
VRDYTLTVSDKLLLHTMRARLAQSPLLLQDFAADLTKADIDVLVASGDYFGSLATSLDSLSQELSNDGKDTEHVILEKIINTLLYIESKYTITRK